MIGLFSLFVGGGLALLVVVMLGQEQAFYRAMGGTVTQEAQFVFTVGLLPLVAFRGAMGAAVYSKTAGLCCKNSHTIVIHNLSIKEGLSLVHQNFPSHARGTHRGLSRMCCRLARLL